jgi:hypothetical protein
MHQLHTSCKEGKSKKKRKKKKNQRNGCVSYKQRLTLVCKGTFRLFQQCAIDGLGLLQNCIIIIMSNPQGKLVRLVSRPASRHTWKAEFEWYRQNFHGFLHTSLLGPICFIILAAPYVVAKKNTIIMAITWGIIGGFSITIGEWVTIPKDL